MKIFFLLLLSFLSLSLSVSANDSSDSMLTKLDASLRNKHQFEEVKLKQIKQLSKRFLQTKDLEESYQLCVKLYDAYKLYQYDSAYVYANKSLQLAQKLHNPDNIIGSKCSLTFCLLSAGLYKEAFDEISTADISKVSPQKRCVYFQTLNRLYYDIADFNHAQPYHDHYVKQGNIYTDSVLHYLKPQSSEWLYAVAMRQMKDRHYDDCIFSFKKLLKMPGVDTHVKAIVTSCLGWIAMSQNEKDTGIYYLAQAAIYDNELVTKENTALRMLANHLYKNGNITKATTYVRLSLDDANFYNARQRKIEIGSILPIIAQDRYNIVQKQRNTMIVAAVIASLFIIGLLFSVLLIRRQMKKLQAARQTIEERNKSLQSTNKLLQEANKIKNEYIGKSFYMNAEYLEQVEKLYKMVDRKIAARQYEDLRSSLKESTLLSARKNMYTGFDETFLVLFPDFVTKFNSLFNESDRRMPDNAQSLTTEMRIFALIRLGVTDSDKIAKFLNYSVHTINTYKTRVKNKSIVDNDCFEQHIMEI